MTLRAAGRETEVSDLYAMGWDPVVNAADYGHDPAGPFQVAHVAGRAHTHSVVSEVIHTDQRRIDRADAIAVQFPMWWFGMLAIIKGWLDEVWPKGCAYGHRSPKANGSATGTARWRASAPWPW